MDYLFSVMRISEWGTPMSFYKQCIVAGFIASFSLLNNPVDGYTAVRPKTPLRSGLGMLVGFKTIDLGQATYFDHHASERIPDGYNLGSAGITKLGPSVEMAYFGMGYQKPLSNHVLLTAGLGALRGLPSNRNGNTLRPAGLGAVAYSDVNIGGFSSIGLSYYYKRFFAGAEFEYDVIKIRHGVDWYNKDEPEAEEYLRYFSGGPKIGYYVFNNLSLEGSVLVGENPSYNAVIRWSFFK